MATANVLKFPASPTARRATAATEHNAELKNMHTIDRAADVLDRLEERAAAIAKQIARLQAAKALVEQRAERIEDRILAEMAKLGVNKANGFRRTLQSRPNPAKLVIVNESLIPREWMRERLDPAKDAIKRALLQGADIAGVKLAQGVALLRKENA